MIIYHNELNPILWDEDNQLKPEVEQKLIDVYKEFVSQLKQNEIPIDVIDVLLLGSNAAYNYTDYSDVDLHIVVDFEDLPLDKTLTQVFYNDEKSKFNNDYNITIKELPVEVYIEDVNAGTESNGIYSLLQQKWIKFPEYNPPKEVDYSMLLDIYKKKVSDVLSTESSEKIKELLNEIKMLRKISLMDGGEYSKGNLVFKELRNDGSLDMLYDQMHDIKSKELSLEQKQVSYSYDKENEQYIIKSPDGYTITEYNHPIAGNKVVTESWERNRAIGSKPIRFNNIEDIMKYESYIWQSKK